MRTSPPITYFDSAGNASKASTLPATGSSTTFTDNAAAVMAAFNISTSGPLMVGSGSATNSLASYVHDTADATLTGG